MGIWLIVDYSETALSHYYQHVLGQAALSQNVKIAITYYTLHILWLTRSNQIALHENAQANQRCQQWNDIKCVPAVMVTTTKCNDNGNS
jgi:hypothetical protein